jgi:crotonobetainyl-CoA:carnitine CoA-transferase CaiB-like acyl-CoA transferase
MAGKGILDGLKVIDLTQNVAGPFCTQILGDLGAEVIKIERPGEGDDARQWRPPEVAGQSATFLALNRNKRSLCVDVDNPEGQELVRDLARKADVFIHSLKPGSAERRGLGEVDLRAINPRLIYSAISAFGQSGPLAPLPGYDPLMQAFTGIMAVTGEDGSAPVRAGVSLVDMGTGLWSALGILAALLRRKDDGKGSSVEASLLETGVSWMTVFAAGYFATGKEPRRMGSAMAIAAPYELFAAADGHVFIAAGNDRLFRAVCTGLGRVELADDPRFASNPQRVGARAALHEEIEALIRHRPAKDIVASLRAVGAPCSELNGVGDMVADEQVRATEIIRSLPLATVPDHRVVALPLRIDGERGDICVPPPALGGDTDAVLAELGLTAGRIAELRDCGAIV